MGKISIKEAIIATATIIIGFANAYFWQNLIYSADYSDPAAIFLPVATMFSFAILFSLLALFSKNIYVIYLACALSVVNGLIIADRNATVLIGTVLGMSGIVYAARKIQSDVNDSKTFGLSKSLSRGLPFFFTTFALIISLTYFSSILLAESNFIPRPIFNASTRILQNYLGGLIPGFRPNATINEVLTDVLATELKNQIDINKIPKRQLNTLLQEQKAALSEKIGIKVSGEEKTTELLYNLANQKLEELFGQYKIYLPYISAIGFFLAIKTLTWPLYFVTLGFIFFTVKFLLVLGILKRELSTTQIEKLTF